LSELGAGIAPPTPADSVDGAAAALGVAWLLTGVGATVP